MQLTILTGRAINLLVSRLIINPKTMIADVQVEERASLSDESSSGMGQSQVFVQGIKTLEVSTWVLT